MTIKNRTNKPTSTEKKAGTQGFPTCGENPVVAQALEKLRQAVSEIARGATAGRLEAS